MEIYLKNLTTEYSTEMRGNKAQRRSKLQYSLEASLSCPIFSDMKIFFLQIVLSFIGIATEQFAIVKKMLHALIENKQSNFVPNLSAVAWLDHILFIIS